MFVFCSALLTHFCCFPCSPLPRDDYALNILDAPARPPQCVAADPENPLCQIEGEYTVQLNDFAIKAPYAHMAQKCPSKAPKYDKPIDC